MVLAHAWRLPRAALDHGRPSVWSFNDYRSLYPGTESLGFRPWGLVDEERRPRGSYELLQREQRPLLLEMARRESGRLALSIRNRADFPAFAIAGATLRLEWIGQDGAGLGAKEAPMPALDPGQLFETEIDAPASAARVRIIARRAPGWIALDREVDFR